MDGVFNVIGFNRPLGSDGQDRTLTPEEEELSDIYFARYRDVKILENYSVIKITTRTGGGNRLDYKENIRDIRDHSLYVDDCDCPTDETYAWFYFRVPPEKQHLLKEIYPDAHEILDREFSTENKVWNKINNPKYVDYDTDTDYSDEADFTHRYGYWHNNEGDTETDDDKSDTDMGDKPDADVSMGDTVGELVNDVKKMEL